VNWLLLTDDEQLDEIISASYQHPIAIFKHSTRCSVSLMAKKAMEQQERLLSDIPLYFLDLLAHRSISDRIAELFDVRHESPQLLLIHHGKAIYHASHSEIDPGEVHRMASVLA
jgi:bacillithiol system protein YtxJ